MRKIRNIIVYLLIVFFILQSYAYAEDSKCLARDFIIIGNENISSDVIKSYLDYNFDKCISENQINEIVAQLYKSGFFNKINYKINDDKLFINVEENPLIASIYIRGNSKLKDKIINNLIELKKGELLNDVYLLKSKNSIIDSYRNHGYFFVTVNANVVRKKDGTADVSFNISEGKKIYISNIVFHGNKEFSSRYLRSIVKTKEFKIWTFLSGKHIFDEERLVSDKDILRYIYYINGYASFSVVSTVLDIKNEKAILHFILDEGPLYHIQNIDFNSNNNTIEEKKIREALLIKSGDRFNIVNINESIKNLEISYEKNTKVDNTVDVDYVYDKTFDNKINITYNLNEKPVYYIKDIDITGNIRTKDHVIRKRIKMSEGDIYSDTDAILSERSLKAVGFFKDVSVNKVYDDVNNEILLNFNVEEKQTGNVGVHGSFDSIGGLKGRISVSEDNLLGSGRIITLSVERSSYNFDIYSGITDRNFLGKDVAGGISLYYKDSNLQKISSYNSYSRGLYLLLSGKLIYNIQGKMSLTLDDTRIDDVPDNASRSVKEQEGKTRSVITSFGTVYNSVNNNYNPSGGSYIALNSDIAGLLGGDTRYIKLSASGYKIVNNLFGDGFKDFITKLSFSCGKIINFNTRDLRITERFGVGEQDIRGFASGGIGPRDYKTLDVIGGENYLTSSIQFNFPLIGMEKMNIRGSIFLDTGAVFGIESKNNKYIIDDNTLRISPGIGLVWISPVGPMRFNYAVPIQKGELDVEKNITFGMGSIF